MPLLDIILVGSLIVVLNTIIGLLVIGYLDHKTYGGELTQWVTDCPYWVLGFITFNCWFIILWMHLTREKNDK